MFILGDIIKNGVHYGSGLPIETYHKINNISNPNLLTNPNFKINTKGLNVYSSNLDRFETVDKWYAQKNISVLLGDEGLTITNTSDTDHDMTGFCQDIDNVSDMVGKTLTMTLCAKGHGIITAYPIKFEALGSNEIELTNEFKLYKLTGVVPEDIDKIQTGVCLKHTENAEVTIKYIKLEEGKCSTLFTTPNYEIEKLKCIGVDNIVKKDDHVFRYGIRIEKNNSDPYERITYMYDAVGMTPAKMDYVNGVFDYGSWKDVWFIKDNKPVMLNYDGTEAYELNPNDYSKKIDGSASDVANLDFNGNAMSRIPLVYVSMSEDYKYEYYAVSNVKYDETYKAIAHTGANGNVRDNIYLAMFEGCSHNSKLRSISGSVVIRNATAEQEINFAKDNGNGWYTRTWGQRMLINILLMIMSKNDNSQEVFGNGVINTHVDDSGQDYGMIRSGTLNDKGQFFGYNDETHAMKVFHMENWWGNQWERIAGLILDHGVLKASYASYNLDGNGYEKIGISNLSNGWQSVSKATKYGRLPVEFNGSSNTYTCDHLWVNNDIISYLLVGGHCSDGSYCGAWYVSLSFTASSSYWDIGASLSFL